MSKLVENGSTVSVHYKGTLNDGTEFDSSHSRGEPIQFQAGSGQMIAGFDNAVIGMSVGDKKSVTIPFAEAYGPKDEAAVPEANLISKAQFLFFSHNGSARWWQVWKWPFAIRYGRIGDGIT